MDFDTADAADQRVFTHAQVQLDAERSLHVHLLNAQLSFSPNGTLQRQQIEQLVNYAADLSGPVILTADMQLFADGRFDVTTYQPLSRLGYRDYARVTDLFEIIRPDD